MDTGECRAPSNSVYSPTDHYTNGTVASSDTFLRILRQNVARLMLTAYLRYSGRISIKCCRGWGGMESVDSVYHLLNPFFNQHFRLWQSKSRSWISNKPRRTNYETHEVWHFHFSRCHGGYTAWLFFGKHPKTGETVHPREELSGCNWCVAGSNRFKTGRVGRPPGKTRRSQAIYRKNEPPRAGR